MFTREITVQPSDVSCQGTLKLKSLLDYFQNTAGLAVEDIEGTTTELIARGYAWVLTRYEINIERLPTLDEKFIIKTFHDPSHGYNMLRAFQVDASDGKRIIDAKSSWFLVDVKTGRPVKSAAHVPEVLTINTGDINPDFQDIPEFSDDETLRSVNFPVRFHDLDYNAHVNNAIYFGWVHDECPVNFADYELKKVCASFRSGAKLGENITLKISEPEKNNFTCRIFRPEIKKPSAEFLFIWQEKEA